MSLKCRPCACFLLLFLAFAVAQPSLYGPEAPLDVAWVRVLNASSTDALAAEVAGGPMELGFAEASAYVMLPPGRHSLTVDGQLVELQAEPEDFLTVALTDGGPVVVSDPALRDISRGLLGLMNLTALPSLSLLTPDGTPVVEEVPPGLADAIAISAARTGLQVSADGTALLALEEHTFERGVAYSVVVFQATEELVAVVLTATVDD